MDKQNRSWHRRVLRPGVVALAVAGPGLLLLLLASTGSGQPPGPAGAALLLRADEVTPFTVVCNAAGDDTGTVVSAYHCANNARFVAIGGTSACSSDGWTIRPISVVHEGPSDLAIVEWLDTDTDTDTDNADNAAGGTERAEASRQHNGPDGVRARGFAREGGDGAMSCELVEVELRPVSVERCVEVTDRHEPSDIDCLSGAPVCPGWSGAGVFDEDGLRSVIVAGTACGDPDGVVIASEVNPRAPSPAGRPDEKPTAAGDLGPDPSGRPASE